MSYYIDLKDKQFGLLTVVESTGKTSEDNYQIWKCECKCGNVVYKTTANLNHDNCTSCGCLRSETMKISGFERIKKYNDERIVNGIDIKALERKNLNKNNTSGYKGVTWNEKRGKWIAQIYYHGKHHRLGRFTDIKDAVNARKEAEDRLKEMLNDLN